MGKSGTVHGAVKEEGFREYFTRIVHRSSEDIHNEQHVYSVSDPDGGLWCKQDVCYQTADKFEFHVASSVASALVIDKRSVTGRQNISFRINGRFGRRVVSLGQFIRNSKIRSSLGRWEPPTPLSVSP